MSIVSSVNLNCGMSYEDFCVEHICLSQMCVFCALEFSDTSQKLILKWSKELNMAPFKSYNLKELCSVQQNL